MEHKSPVPTVIDPKTVTPSASESSFSKHLAWVVTWARRGSAWLLWSLCANWAIGGLPPRLEIQRWLDPCVVGITTLPHDRVWTALAILWYAFLSQMRVGWAIGLPFYLLLYPLFWVLYHVVRMAVGAGGGQFKAVADAKPTSHSKTKKKRRFVAFLKCAWVLLFILWAAVLRDLNDVWVAWIPPLLVFPIWWSLLRLAYTCAVSPKVPANGLAAICVGMLDAQIQANRQDFEKGRKVQPANWLCSAVESVLRRYPDDSIVLNVHRESLAAFSFSLVAALAASSWFWGLVGVASMKSSDELRQGYDFFQSGSLAEATLWAWGCMTTTIDFPGGKSPLWVKGMHALVLATGLFQITFLLACFSIMAGADGARSGKAVKEVLRTIREKLSTIKAMEVQDTVTVEPQQPAIPNDEKTTKSPPNDHDQLPLP